MKRRAFITLLGGAAIAWPLAARGQQAKLPTIGVLGASTPLNWNPWTAAFVQRLRELGWIEGRTVAIEYRWAEGRNERYSDIATEFVRLKVDVILTTGTAVPAAKQVTSTIPIVFATATDPVGSGLVASLARPGGNVTARRDNQSMLPANGSRFCMSCSPICNEWRSSAMSTMTPPSGRSVRFRPQPLNSASTPTYSKSDMPEMSCPPSRRSRAGRRRFRGRHARSTATAGIPAY